MPKPAQPFKQAIAEDSLESTTVKRKRKKKKYSTVSSSNPVNTSPWSAMPRLRTMSTCRVAFLPQHRSNSTRSISRSNPPFPARFASCLSAARLSARLHSIRGGYGGYRPRICARIYGRCILDVAVQGFGHEGMASFPSSWACCHGTARLSQRLPPVPAIGYVVRGRRKSGAALQASSIFFTGNGHESRELRHTLDLHFEKHVDPHTRWKKELVLGSPGQIPGTEGGWRREECHHGGPIHG